MTNDWTVWLITPMLSIVCTAVSLVVCTPLSAGVSTPVFHSVTKRDLPCVPTLLCHQLIFPLLWHVTHVIITFKSSNILMSLLVSLSFHIWCSGNIWVYKSLAIHDISSMYLYNRLFYFSSCRHWIITNELF